MNDKSTLKGTPVSSTPARRIGRPSIPRNSRNTTIITRQSPAPPREQRRSSVDPQLVAGDPVTCTTPVQQQSTQHQPATIVTRTTTARREQAHPPPPPPVPLTLHQMPHYNNWVGVSDLTVYVTAAQLSDLLLLLQQIPFSNRASRDEGASAINGLNRRRIVGERQRFPEKHCFVDVTSSPVALLLNRLLSALSYVDSHEGNNNHNTQSRDVYDDNKLSYTKSLERLWQLVGKQNATGATAFGFYTRETFEVCYGIVWDE